MTDNSGQPPAGDLVASREALADVKAKIEQVLTSPITPVALAGLYAVFMLRLSFYCNYIGVPFFDFMGATGIYIGIFAVLGAFFFSVSISYYFFPVHVSNELRERLKLNKFVAACLSSVAGVFSYVLIAAIIISKFGNILIFAVSFLFILAIIFVISVIYFFHARDWKKSYEIVVAANFFSLSQCLITSAAVVALLKSTSSPGVVRMASDSIGGGVLWAEVGIFILAPILFQIFVYTIPGLGKPKDIVIASGVIGFFLIFWSFDWTMNRIVGFLNLGGDVRAELVFRPESREAAVEMGLYTLSSNGTSRPVPAILRFQGNSYAFVYLGKRAQASDKPNILAVSLRDVSVIHTCENQSDDDQGCGSTH